MSELLKAHISLGLAMAIIGSSVSVGKLVIEHMPLFLASGLRYGLSAVILFWLLGREKGTHQFPNRRQYRVLFLQSMSGQFLFSVFLLNGLQYISATESGILTSSMPAVLALLSWLMLKEGIGRHKWLGIACVALGMLLMNGMSAVQAGVVGGNILLGSLLVFCAVVGEALFTVFGKIVACELSPVTVASHVSLIGFVSFLPFAIWEAFTFNFAVVPFKVWFALIMYGSVITVIPFVLICYGLRLASGGAAAILTGVMPVSGLICASLLLGEPVYWFHGLGVGGVLLGLVFLAQDTRQAITCKRPGFDAN